MCPYLFCFVEYTQTDMLLECCGFGKVRTIQLLTLPPHYLAAVATASTNNSNGSTSSNSGAGISVLGVLGGAIGVTFEQGADAENCASKLRDRRFDGRILKTFVLPPRTVVDPLVPIVETISNSKSIVTSAVVPPPPPPPPRPPSVKYVPVSTVPVQVSTNNFPGDVNEESTGPDIEAISNDVDDFLSSLL